MTSPTRRHSTKHLQDGDLNHIEASTGWRSERHRRAQVKTPFLLAALRRLEVLAGQMRETGGLLCVPALLCGTVVTMPTTVFASSTISITVPASSSENAVGSTLYGPGNRTMQWGQHSTVACAWVLVCLRTLTSTRGGAEGQGNSSQTQHFRNGRSLPWKCIGSVLPRSVLGLRPPSTAKSREHRTCKVGEAQCVCVDDAACIGYLVAHLT